MLPGTPRTLGFAGQRTVNRRREAWPVDKLRLIDVGAAGGVQPTWLTYADRIMPILFEPNPAEAAKLRDTIRASFDNALVLETGLSNVVGPQQLNITRYWGCTSLLQPNADVLSKYRISSLFDVTSTEMVECTRYDVLYNEGRAPAPDAIKIDVQGFEYEILQGFGALLQTCLGIQLETHVYPIYKNQKLLHHLISFLADFGFVLRALTPVPSFDGDVVELDVWLTKDIQAWRRLDPSKKEHFRMICAAWNLVDYSRIDPAAHHNQIDPL
jgi:FkbM family methyltransferase